MFKTEMKNHLTGKLLPFWMRLQDGEYGGYYGYVDYDLKVDKEAVKGCILNSRILWTFSNAYLLFREKRYLAAAEHAWKFLRDHCVDKVNGGVFWSVTYDGKPAAEPAVDLLIGHRILPEWPLPSSCRQWQRT